MGLLMIAAGSHRRWDSMASLVTPDRRAVVVFSFPGITSSCTCLDIYIGLRYS